MRRIIALEDTLEDYRDILSKEGYEVRGMDEGLENVDAVIVSGMEENIMGMQDRRTGAFIINARGRQPEEILYDLEKHFKLAE